MPQLYSDTTQQPPVPSSPMTTCSFDDSLAKIAEQIDIFIMRAFELQKVLPSLGLMCPYTNLDELFQEICQKSQMLRIQLKNIKSEMNMRKNHNEKENKGV